MPPLTDRDHKPSEIVSRLYCYRDVAGQIQNGLAGQPFSWDGTEGEYNVQWAADMGIHLVTETWIRKHGYRLKRGAQPVGHRYFHAPISKKHPVYVLECQAVKREDASSAAALPAPEGTPE